MGSTNWASISHPPATATRYEYTAAFLLLRLFLGLRTLQAGIDKFESKGTYSFANVGPGFVDLVHGAPGLRHRAHVPMHLRPRRLRVLCPALGHALPVGDEGWLRRAVRVRSRR